MKRKKKKNTIQHKQEQRHRQNEFFKKLKHVMGLLGDASAYDLLDKKNLFVIYHTRIRPFKIINPTEGKRAPKAALRFMNESLSKVLQQVWVELGGQKISLYDFSVYAETLFFVWRNIDTDEPVIGEQFRACFPVFESEEFVEQRLKTLQAVERQLEVLTWLFCDFTSSTVRIIREEQKKSRSAMDQSAFFNNYIVEQKEAETESLEIDGHRRTIFRVCLSYKLKFTPLTLTPDRLGMGGMMQQFPLKVFIQKHALVRMEERLGKAVVHVGYMYVIYSILRDPVPTGQPNSFLFPMFDRDTKLGYLKGDVIGDKLVIRTFLFLTNNGTPEGKKLQELIGVAKLDKAYLGIDKLRTFISSDITENQPLKDLFCQAGCGGLFRLDKHSWLLESDKNKMICADRLAGYLGLQQAVASDEINNETARVEEEQLTCLSS